MPDTRRSSEAACARVLEVIRAEALFGRHYPTGYTIARQCGISLRTAYRTVAQLEEQGRVRRRLEVVE